MKTKINVIGMFLVICFLISCNSVEKKQQAAKTEQAAKDEQALQSAMEHNRQDSIARREKERRDSAVRKGIDYWYAMQKKEGKYVAPKKEERYTLPAEEEKHEDSNQTGSQIGRCTIKSNAYATTSKADFDMLGNCLANGDKKAVESMMLNGQVTILHQNDVVYLVDTKLFAGWCIVRPAGSTQEFYVNVEAIKTH